MPRPLTTREKLIMAAARVYAASGFRGATTRRIAEEAGLNEVTIFRTFGSKAALIDEALRQSSEEPPGCVATLPDPPVDPQAELTAWCEAQLAELCYRRRLIRQMMGEMAEKPEMGGCVSRGSEEAADELRRYVRQLERLGFLGSSPRPARERNEETRAAGAMLMAALFGDAIGRDMMPDVYPQPAGRAPALYARLFLRAIRCLPPGDVPTNLAPAGADARKGRARPQPQRVRR
ncbi:MAG: TetR/AcrR family transcriptional regulator [Gemmatimonadaceae bacterium]